MGGYEKSFEGQNLPKYKQLEANRLSLANDAPHAKQKKEKRVPKWRCEWTHGIPKAELTDGSRWGDDSNNQAVRE